MVSASSPDRLSRLIDEIAQEPSMNEGILAIRERGRFDGQTTTLVGISLVDRARQFLDDELDRFWQHDYASNAGMASAGHDEVIVGGGYHAAVYARVRTILGYPKPLVIDSGRRVGGQFACSRGPSFYLNSRNRAGDLNSPGEGAALNVIPGSPIQPSMLSSDEYQRNNDMAYLIRMTLATSARVMPMSKVKEFARTNRGRRPWRVKLDDGRSVLAGRVVVASGLGNYKRIVSPPRPNSELGESIVTFGQFMGMMDERFPFRGLRRIAVIGDGDSALCALEAIFGIGPARHWSIPELDNPEVVDWYGRSVPIDCTSFIAGKRTRYKRLAPFLPNDGRTVARIRPTQLIATAEPTFGGALVDGKRYDLVVNCSGFNRTSGILNGNTSELARLYSDGSQDDADNTEIVGAGNVSKDFIAVGPCYDIGFSPGEERQGYTRRPENRVAIWRLGRRTARAAQILAGV